MCCPAVHPQMSIPPFIPSRRAGTTCRWGASGPGQNAFLTTPPPPFNLRIDLKQTLKPTLLLSIKSATPNASSGNPHGHPSDNRPPAGGDAPSLRETPILEFNWTLQSPFGVCAMPNLSNAA